MAAWAYLCRLCGGQQPTTAYVSASTVAEMPAACRIVLVRVDGQWRCALVDRDRRHAVDRMLLRDVCVGDAGDCPDCAELLADEDRGEEQAPSPAAGAGGSVQAAAVEVDGRRLVVVLVSEALIDAPTEADMAIERLAPQFAGATVILLAQREDGKPRYYGEPGLCERIAHHALERLPWKIYPLT